MSFLELDALSSIGYAVANPVTSQEVFDLKNLQMMQAAKLSYLDEILGAALIPTATKRSALVVAVPLLPHVAFALNLNT